MEKLSPESYNFARFKLLEQMEIPYIPGTEPEKPRNFVSFEDIPYSREQLKATVTPENCNTLFTLSCNLAYHSLRMIDFCSDILGQRIKYNYFPESTDPSPARIALKTGALMVRIEDLEDCIDEMKAFIDEAGKEAATE